MEDACIRFLPKICIWSNVTEGVYLFILKFEWKKTNLFFEDAPLCTSKAHYALAAICATNLRIMWKK